MTATKNQAVEAATAEGLAYFWANMHTGHAIAFVGQSWEDGGFRVNGDGEPTKDARGNTVATFTSDEIDPTNAAHVAQCEEWYGAN